MPYERPIVIEEEATRHSLIPIVALTAGLTFVLAAPIEATVRIALLLWGGVAVAAELPMARRRKAAREPTRAIWRPTTGWLLEAGDKKPAPGILCPGTRVFPWLIVLRWRIRGQGYRTCLVRPDTLGVDAHRRLRVILRLGRG